MQHANETKAWFQSATALPLNFLISLHCLVSLPWPVPVPLPNPLTQLSTLLLKHVLRLMEIG